MKKHQFINVILVTMFFSLITIPSVAQYGIAMAKQWGEFGDKPGQFKYPTMIAADKSSNIYVVDQHNHRIQKFDSDGEFLTQWYTSGIFDDSKHFPLGITTTKNGSIYVTDHYAHCIQKY